MSVEYGVLTRLELFGCVALVACSGPAAAPVDKMAPLEIFEAVPTARGAYKLVGAKAAVPGRVYTLVGEAATPGAVRAEGLEGGDCDDCAGVRSRASVVEGAGPGVGAEVAIGPTDAVLTRARVVEMHRPAANDLGPTWRATVRVDVDGDGAADFDLVERCAARVPSGCASSVCSKTCVATRSAARGGATYGEYCHAFVPDTEDCVPGADAH